MSDYYIGLISGTSVDGIDAVVVDFATHPPQLISSLCFAIDQDTQQQIVQLCDEKLTQGELNAMAQLDRRLGQLFAQAALAVCEQAQLTPQQITAIGHHGQTIRHYPKAQHGFTLQIGDPNTVAVQTGIAVVADFRRKDIALGGQGAPMVPAFHQAVFSDEHIPRFIVNIGGIANITYLPSKQQQTPIIGFDTGPGNTLLDKWTSSHIGKPYDQDGQWARQGNTQPSLLNSLLQHPYLGLPAPKSTGREDFNRSWLATKLKNSNYKSVDVQATLVDFTAITIAEQINQLGHQHDIQAQVYVCGGGASNGYLLERLTAQLPDHSVYTTNALGINPDWVEAMAFAWLAKAYQMRLTGNIASVTGAKCQTVLGAMYLP